MKWISVKDRLPDIIGTYLVCHKTRECKYIDYCFFNSQQRWFNYGAFFKEADYIPTHWMELPKPPGKTENEWNDLSDDRQETLTDIFYGHFSKDYPVAKLIKEHPGIIEKIFNEWMEQI